MTDNTQPEALRLADELCAAPERSSTSFAAAAELRHQHHRIAELEAQLEAIGAGGVSGPLMGQSQAMPDLSALTGRGAKTWAGVDAQVLREGFTAADMATASAQGFRDGVASVAHQPITDTNTASGAADANYHLIDRFLRNNLYDDDYAEYSAALDALASAPAPPAQAADSVLEDAARLERERICAAIKAEDDYCVDQGDYMLDSDDCIKIVRGEWVRPDFSVDAARKQGANHD